MRAAIAVFVGLALATLSCWAQVPSTPTPPTDVTPQQILPNCDAYYPPGELASGIDGTTDISFLVTSEGTTAQVSVLRGSGNKNLDAAAVKCLSNSRYNVEGVTSAGGQDVAEAAVAVHWLHSGHSTYFPGCPYPFDSIRLGERGKTEISFVISKVGDVTNAVVSKSSGFGNLDAVALGCAKALRYTPTMRNGTPAEIDWHVITSFNISG